MTYRHGCYSMLTRQHQMLWLVAEAGEHVRSRSLHTDILSSNVAAGGRASSLRGACGAVPGRCAVPVAHVMVNSKQ